MAENKKGFVLYCDLIHTVNQLPNDKAGELFKHVLSYVNDEYPVTDDLLINVTFEPIKQQLKRDLKKYESRQKQFSDAGKRSAEVRKLQREATTLNNVNKRSTNPTVTVTVKDTVTDIKEKKKTKKVFSPPSYEDFMIYAVSQYKTKEHYMGFKQNLTRKFNTWKENGWINERTNKPIKLWKATLGNTIPFIPKDN